MRTVVLVSLFCLASFCRFCSAQEGRCLFLQKELVNKDNLKVSDVVYAILQRGDIRLNFEDVELSSENAITVSSELGKLNFQSKRSLLEKERALLHRAEVLRNNGAPGTTVLEYNVPILKPEQLGIGLLGPDAVLERITRLIPDYSLSKSNGSYVLFWNKVKYPKISELRIEKATPIEAYNVLIRNVLKNLKLNFVSFDPVPYAKDPAKRISLDLHDVDLHTALMRFSEALGNDVVWSISGPASNRMISFSRLRPGESIQKN